MNGQFMPFSVYVIRFCGEKLLGKTVTTKSPQMVIVVVPDLRYESEALQGRGLKATIKFLPAKRRKRRSAGELEI